MLRLLAWVINILLTGIILFQLPKESVGLSTFALGASSSSQRLFNVLTILGILLYLGLAFKLNLS